MSPTFDTTALMRRRLEGDHDDGGDLQDDQVLPAIEDGREIEDRIIGQELTQVPSAAAAAATAVLTQFRSGATAEVDFAMGVGAVVQSEGPRPEDIPVPASPFPTPGPSTVLKRLEQGRDLTEAVTPMAYPKGRPRSLFPLFTDEQLNSMERSQREAAHLYGQRSLTEPRPSYVSHEEAMRAYAKRRDEEQEVLWKMLQEARRESELLRCQNDDLQAELRKYKALADLQFKTPLGSRDGGSEKSERRETEAVVREVGKEKAADPIPKARQIPKGLSQRGDALLRIRAR